MTNLYDHNAPKKPTNLSINSDLLKIAKSLNINLSATMEQALTNILAIKAAKQWKEKNSKAISSYNDIVAKSGCFSDEFRGF